mmetsp:Transcript_105234/g.267372  ORF Transcript_105234/g.267372 Transcript_105234/m.267372 type:complete len:233 (-) Transcript_105234:7-705(-)
MREGAPQERSTAVRGRRDHDLWMPGHADFGRCPGRLHGCCQGRRSNDHCIPALCEPKHLLRGPFGGHAVLLKAEPLRASPADELGAVHANGQQLRELRWQEGRVCCTCHGVVSTVVAFDAGQRPTGRPGQPAPVRRHERPRHHQNKYVAAADRGVAEEQTRADEQPGLPDASADGGITWRLAQCRGAAGLCQPSLRQLLAPELANGPSTLPLMPARRSGPCACSVPNHVSNI